MILVPIIIVLIISVYYGPFVITHNGSNKLFSPRQTSKPKQKVCIISISAGLSLKQRIKMNKAHIVSSCEIKIGIILGCVIGVERWGLNFFSSCPVESLNRFVEDLVYRARNTHLHAHMMTTKRVGRLTT